MTGGIDGTPAWAYDEDGYCVSCGNGHWKHHMPGCELRDALDALADEDVSVLVTTGRQVVLCEPHWNIVWVGDVSQPGAWPNHCRGGSFIEGAGAWDCHMVRMFLVADAWSKRQ